MGSSVEFRVKESPSGGIGQQQSSQKLKISRWKDKYAFYCVGLSESHDRMAHPLKMSLFELTVVTDN